MRASLRGLAPSAATIRAICSAFSSIRCEVRSSICARRHAGVQRNASAAARALSSTTSRSAGVAVGTRAQLGAVPGRPHHQRLAAAVRSTDEQPLLDQVADPHRGGRFHDRAHVAHLQVALRRRQPAPQFVRCIPLTPAVRTGAAGGRHSQLQFGQNLTRLVPARALREGATPSLRGTTWRPPAAILTLPR